MFSQPSEYRSSSHVVVPSDGTTEERPPCAVSLLFRVRTLALHSCTRSCSMSAWDAMPKVEQAEKITELEYRAAP
jgi:hypothetical protein